MVLRYRIHLEKRHYAPATINRASQLSAGSPTRPRMPAYSVPELAARIRRVKGVRRIGVRLGNWLRPEQRRSLLERCDAGTPRERRDRAMLAVLIGCGLRRAERLTLTLESIQQREDHWVIADWLARADMCAPYRSRPK